MSNNVQRYSELFMDLLLQRELAGGALSDDIEALFVAQLDRYWWEMTGDEQSSMENVIARMDVVDAPMDLGTTDVRLDRGQRSMARKAA